MMSDQPNRIVRVALIAMAAFFCFTISLKADLTDPLPDEIPMPTVKIEDVVIVPDGWKKVTEEPRAVTLTSGDGKITVSIRILPGVLVHDDMISVGATQTLEAALDSGTYPTDLDVKQVRGVRSIVLEGVHRKLFSRIWTRSYLIPAKEAPYYVTISRQPGEEWPDIEELLKFEDVESPFAKSFLDFAVRESPKQLRSMQKEAREKPGFIEPDLSD